MPSPLSAPAPPPPVINMSTNNNNHSFNHSDYSLSSHPEKITSMIRNWNIKFDGSKTGLTVDEFIYRITSMTTAQLAGSSIRQSSTLVLEIP